VLLGFEEFGLSNGCKRVYDHHNGALPSLGEQAADVPCERPGKRCLRK